MGLEWVSLFAASVYVRNGNYLRKRKTFFERGYKRLINVKKLLPASAVY